MVIFKFTVSRKIRPALPHNLVGLPPRTSRKMNNHQHPHGQQKPKPRLGQCYPLAAEPVVRHHASFPGRQVGNQLARGRATDYVSLDVEVDSSLEVFRVVAPYFVEGRCFRKVEHLKLPRNHEPHRADSRNVTDPRRAPKPAPQVMSGVPASVPARADGLSPWMFHFPRPDNPLSTRDRAAVFRVASFTPPRLNHYCATHGLCHRMGTGAMLRSLKGLN